MDQAATGDLSIAVLLPCYNEAATIASVVRGFRLALPTARIFVYDNNSTDGTALAAMLSGAEVRRERRQGKGHVVRRMFADIDADIYVMADGDGTYAPDDAEELIRTLLTERVDMVVGTGAACMTMRGARAMPPATGCSTFSTGRCSGRIFPTSFPATAPLPAVT